MTEREIPSLVHLLERPVPRGLVRAREHMRHHIERAEAKGALQFGEAVLKQLDALIVTWRHLGTETAFVELHNVADDLRAALGKPRLFPSGDVPQN